MDLPRTNPGHPAGPVGSNRSTSRSVSLATACVSSMRGGEPAGACWVFHRYKALWRIWRRCVSPNINQIKKKLKIGNAARES